MAEQYATYDWIEELRGGSGSISSEYAIKGAISIMEDIIILNPSSYGWYDFVNQSDIVYDPKRIVTFILGEGINTVKYRFDEYSEWTDLDGTTVEIEKDNWIYWTSTPKEGWYIPYNRSGRSYITEDYDITIDTKPVPVQFEMDDCDFRLGTSKTIKIIKSDPDPCDYIIDSLEFTPTEWKYGTNSSNTFYSGTTSSVSMSNSTTNTGCTVTLTGVTSPSDDGGPGTSGYELPWPPDDTVLDGILKIIYKQDGTLVNDDSDDVKFHIFTSTDWTTTPDG